MIAEANTIYVNDAAQLSIMDDNILGRDIVKETLWSDLREIAFILSHLPRYSINLLSIYCSDCLYHFPASLKRVIQNINPRSLKVTALIAADETEAFTQRQCACDVLNTRHLTG